MAAKSHKFIPGSFRSARQRWSSLSTAERIRLDAYSREFGFSVGMGDLILLGSNWYVTHTGLLRLARRKRCSGIHAQPVMEFCDAVGSRWAFKATVFKSQKCKGFVGYGDADPSNVSAVVRGAEMRVAETRAVNRALRKAYGIGICSVEELGSFSGSLELKPHSEKAPRDDIQEGDNANGYRLRDRLRLLIRQYHLDASLVKLYAAEFCGTQELRQASRQLIEEFIHHLAQCAAHDLDGLLRRLNSYASKPVTSVSDNTKADNQKVAGVA